MYPEPIPLWRGSLLPLECEALPTPAIAILQIQRISWFTAAAHPSGSKLPRHKGRALGIGARPLHT
ncbi:hypothetical protein EI534_04875 [Pseudomonas frederiksbergensis]|nr:hypothetical protein [Pseudomonas frederiksbergensis]